MLTEVTVVQRREEIKCGVNLNTVVSVLEKEDERSSGSKILHVRLANGDYLNVIAPYSEFVSMVNELSNA